MRLCTELSSATLENLHIVRRVTPSQANIWSSIIGFRSFDGKIQVKFPSVCFFDNALDLVHRRLALLLSRGGRRLRSRARAADARTRMSWRATMGNLPFLNRWTVWHNSTKDCVTGNDQTKRNFSGRINHWRSFGLTR